MTFTPDNYYTTGVEYNYDALNEILAELLNDSTNVDDVKNYSDHINDTLEERDGKIYYHDTVVGIVVPIESMEKYAQ